MGKKEVADAAASFDSGKLEDLAACVRHFQ